MRHSWYSIDDLSDWIRNNLLRQKTIYTTDKAAEPSVLTGTVFCRQNGELGKVYRAWVQQVKCERNGCWLWRTYKDLASWCGSTACEKYIKPEGENIKLLHSYDAMIRLPHSFLWGKNTVNLHSLKSARQTVTHFLTTAQTQCQNATSVDHKF